MNDPRYLIRHFPEDFRPLSGTTAYLEYCSYLTLSRSLSRTYVLHDY